MNNIKNFISQIFRAAAVGMIWLYQIMVSPFTGGRAVCRFTPTCSEYTKQAIQKYGVLAGIWKGMKRISRCRPGGGFGYDPV